MNVRIGACHVYRIDPSTGAAAAVATDFEKPNGLAFSQDETRLYIVDTGVTHKVDGPHHVRRFQVSADGRSIAGGGRVRHLPGRRVRRLSHRRARQPVAVGGRWRALSRQRRLQLLGKIRIPEAARRTCCFGGSEAQPAVHLRDDIAVLRVSAHPCRGASRGARSSLGTRTVTCSPTPRTRPWRGDSCRTRASTTCARAGRRSCRRACRRA